MVILLMVRSKSGVGGKVVEIYHYLQRFYTSSQVVGLWGFLNEPSTSYDSQQDHDVICQRVVSDATVTATAGHCNLLEDKEVPSTFQQYLCIHRVFLLFQAPFP